jgi:hypothetical protein
MRHGEAEAVPRGPDVETLASDRQVHLASWLPRQLYTHHHILAARAACSLGSHLKQQQYIYIYIYAFCTHDTKTDRMFRCSCLIGWSPFHIFYIRSKFEISLWIPAGKPEGKRPLGRPRRRWGDNIMMDFVEKGLGELDWIVLAQDR